MRVSTVEGSTNSRFETTKWPGCSSSSPSLYECRVHLYDSLAFSHDLSVFAVVQMIGSFFIMNLFIGVIIENFNTMKKKLGSYGMLTPRQLEWVKARKLMTRMKPLQGHVQPTQPLRKLAYTVVMHPKFDFVIMACILANTVILAMPYFGADDEYLYVVVVVVSCLVVTLGDCVPVLCVVHQTHP